MDPKIVIDGTMRKRKFWVWRCRMCGAEFTKSTRVEPTGNCPYCSDRSRKVFVMNSWRAVEEIHGGYKPKKKKGNHIVDAS